MSAHRQITRGVLFGVAVLGIIAASAAGGASASSNGLIALGNSGQIYSINPDGSGLRQLTHTDSNHVANWPNFSPDGTRILFSLQLANAPGNDDARIWVMNADGSGARQLSHDVAGYRDYIPRYTPDGKHIVFARCLPNDGVCEIAEIRSDGTGMHPLTHFKTGTHEATDFGPTAAPNGDIAFTRFGAGGIISQLWVMHADGSDQHPVTPPALEAGSPRWSPSGRQILFNTNTNRFGSALWVTNPAGTTQHALTHPAYPHNDITPAYAPSGKQIAFASDRAFPDLCCLDLYIANTNGSGIHRINTGLTGVIDVAWGRTP